MPSADPVQPPSHSPTVDPRAVLAELVDLPGRDVLDVGSGDGSLVRWLAGIGARATGVEPGAAPLARAQARPPVAGERHLHGWAEALPVDDATVDVVLFVNSLHHVAPDRMADALREAARVLRPGGSAYVQEPLAEGPLFELVQLVDDETAVRALARRAVETLPAETLELVAVRRIDAHVPTADLGAFRDRVVLADSQRSERFAAHEAHLRDRLARLATTDPASGALGLRQPLQIHLLRRP